MNWPRNKILLVYVGGREEHAPDPRELAEFLIPRMPHYMVPRYFRSASSLPRTPTNKVRKVALREAGLGEDCWDREAAGLQLKRTRFSNTS